MNRVPHVSPLRHGIRSLKMKNIQIIDGADNATFSIFQATPEESGTIFPQRGQDLEVVDNYFARVGEAEAHLVLCAIWERPIHKPDFQGLHGTLFMTTPKKQSTCRKLSESWIVTPDN